MRLKNVVVGEYIEAKHDTEFFKKGDLVKVVAKEYDYYFGEMTLNIMDSDGDTLWVNHKDFRRPRPKKLDQSVFDGLDEKWRFAAVDSDGVASYYDGIPEIRKDHFIYLDAPNGAGQSYRLSGTYDASNWQNSLIERESKELTGNELCKAILDSGANKVLVRVTDHEDVELKDTPITFAYKNDSGNIVTELGCDYWAFITPINNQGEPLTAKDVGL